MINLKHHSKGSTLVILLLTISVVVLIGTMAMSLAVVNFKMKKTNSSVKQNFYLAEAGIEESYIIAREFVDEAVKYAISKVEEFDEIENQINGDFKDRLLSIDSELTEDRKSIIFNEAFKRFIKGTCTDASPNHSLISMLKDNESYVVCCNGYPKISSQLTEFTDYFLINVKSTCVAGHIKNEITLKYKIVVPRYDECCVDKDIKAEDIIEILEWKKER